MSPTSVFFNKFDYSGEQQMLDKLVVEAIQIYGQDMFYIPLRRGNFDGLYYEDDQNYFDKAYQIECYVKTVDGFVGQQSFMSKFGLEIRDEVIISIARTTFDNEVLNHENITQTRPLEGDLIYFPLNKKAFDITFVDNKPFFYQFGKLQMYDCTCQLFEYSNELFSTGIPEIDSLQEKYSFETFDYAIKTESGTGNNVLVTESGTGNTAIVNELYNWNEDNYDPLSDNDRLEDESNRDGSPANTSLIDWSENNPFIGNADEDKF